MTLFPFPTATISPGEPGDRHHRFPRGGKKNWRKWFAAAPRYIDIDTYLRPLTPAEHTGIGGIHPEGYIQAWADFIEANEDATREETFEALRRIEAKFGIPPYP